MITYKTEPYEEQTHMKHKVFQEYFDNWVKILGSANNLNYIDGFSGAGAYKDTKTGKVFFGSPVLAAQTIQANKKEKTTTLVFIDKKQESLNNVKKILTESGLTDLTIHYINDDFDKTINSLLAESKNLAPTFVFIDPFGYKINYQTLKRIMSINKSEILLNFMFNSVSRFMSDKKLDKTITELFGTDEWKEIVKLEGIPREEGIRKLYRQQLKKISKFVMPYRLEFPDKKRTYYYIFHLTNHVKGCSIMKSSFAKYAHGRTEWLGTDADQIKLTEIDGIKDESLENYFITKYSGKRPSFAKIIEENIDETDYLESDMTKAIRKLEDSNRVYIERFPKLTEKRKQMRESLEKNDIIHFNVFPSIERKTLLYKTKVEYGNYTINHVLGCAHGCAYPCYAMMMAQRYGRVKNYDDWIHPRLVSNSLEILDREIPKYKNDIDFVHLCFTTDPFMYDAKNKRTYKEIEKMTLSIIKKLNNNGIKCTVLTKGLYPKELTKDEFLRDNEYGITIVSLDAKFRKEFEPFSAPFEQRIAALKHLHDNRLKTWVSIEPYPTPNIIKQDLSKLLETLSFVDKIIFGKMNYNASIKAYENNEEFYKKCSQTVTDFCTKKRIKLHIKEGTPTNYCNQTEEIFKGEE